MGNAKYRQHRPEHFAHSPFLRTLFFASTVTAYAPQIQRKFNHSQRPAIIGTLVAGVNQLHNSSDKVAMIEAFW
jgi:hypothetical protein